MLWQVHVRTIPAVNIPFKRTAVNIPFKRSNPPHRRVLWSATHVSTSSDTAILYLDHPSVSWPPFSFARRSLGKTLSLKDTTRGVLNLLNPGGCSWGSPSKLQPGSQRSTALRFLFIVLISLSSLTKNLISKCLDFKEILGQPQSHSTDTRQISAELQSQTEASKGHD